jgi:serine/threonine protein kinase
MKNLIFIYIFINFLLQDRNRVYEKIIAGKIDWPRHFDSASKDIIKKLLVQDPTKRLGSGNCGTVAAPATTPTSTSTTTTIITTATPAVSNRSSKPNSPSTSLAIHPNGDITLTEDGKTNSAAIVFLTESLDQSLHTIEEHVMASGARKPPLQSVSSSSHIALNTSAEIANVMSSNTAAHKSIKVNAGCEEVKRHRWFIAIGDWTDVYEKRTRPPFLPEILHAGDTRNFDRFDMTDLGKTPPASDKECNLFANF